jgi:hypothetical protein
MGRAGRSPVIGGPAEARCIAGGLLADEIQSIVVAAGFREVEVRRGSDVFDGASQHSDAAIFGAIGAGIVGFKP